MSGVFCERWWVLWLLLAMAWPASAEQVGDNHFMRVLQEGEGWMIVNIQDLESDGAGTEVYVALGTDGVLRSPMPAQEKAKLAASPASEEGARGQERIYIVHKDIVDSYWQDGAVPEAYTAHSSSSCGTTTGRAAESFSITLPPLEGSQPMDEVSPSGTLSGEITLGVTVELDLDAVVEYEVHRTLCIPSSVAISYVDMEAALRLVNGSLGMDVEATKSWTKTYERQIANPRLWVLPFQIGVIPVVINFKLPTKIGVILATNAVVGTEITVPWSGSFGFNYRCDVEGCGGSSSHAFDVGNPLTNAAADIEAELSIKPFLDSRVRANLYSDRIFYADVGLRAGIQNRLWGYAGNDCGDVDDDGVNEFVQAAIFDSYFDLQLPYSYGGLLGKKEKLKGLYRRSIYFRDFLNHIEDNAMAPSIHGPQDVQQHGSGYYQLWMRPCYPFAADPVVGLSTDLVNFQSSDTYDLSDMPDGANRRFVFEEAGTQMLKAVNQRDAIGRRIGSYSELEVDVEEGVGQPDPCDPVCPPTIIYDLEVHHHENYPDDFRLATFDIDFGLGWDLDCESITTCENDIAELIIEHSLYQEVSDLTPMVTDVIEHEGNYFSTLDHMNVLLRRSYLYDAHDPARKFCLRVDPDHANDLTEDEIDTEICVQMDEGTLYEIALVAALRPNTNTVELTWNDDNSDSTDNDFDLLRSANGGAFTTLAEGWVDLYYDDENVPPGEYRYAIDSQGQRYFSNVVTLGSGTGPVPIYFYDERFFYDDEGGPRMTVQLTDDIPGSEDFHRHEMKIGSGAWFGAGFDQNLSIDSGALLDALTGPHQITFRTSRWDDGVRVSDWYTSPPYPVLIRDWDLRASHGGPPDGDVPPGTIRLTFRDQPDVSFYRIERTRLSTGGVVLIDSANGSPYLDPNVETGETYAYRIRAFDEQWSAVSEGMAFAGSVPGIPSFFEASDDQLNHVYLTWESLEGAQSYELFRSESATSSPGSGDPLTTVPAAGGTGGTVQHFDTSAPVDVPVYYWVRGINSAGNGSFAHTTGFRPTIIQTDLADLTVTVNSVHRVYTACKRPPCPERPLLISYTLTNLGEAAVPAGYTFDVYLSDDQSIGSTDLWVSDQTFQVGYALNPGQSVTLTVLEDRLDAFSTGPFYVLVEADPFDVVLESDETNNIGHLLVPSLPQ